MCMMEGQRLAFMSVLVVALFLGAQKNNIQSLDQVQRLNTEEA